MAMPCDVRLMRAFLALIASNSLFAQMMIIDEQGPGQGPGAGPAARWHAAAHTD